MILIYLYPHLVRYLAFLTFEHSKRRQQTKYLKPELRRMAELCEELSTSLNQLISIQKNMSQLGSLKEVDSLLRNAALQFRVGSTYKLFFY